MGNLVRVDDRGLQALAAQFDAAAAQLAVNAAPALDEQPDQATVASAKGGHGLVEATASVLAARATATAEKLRAAANSYAHLDAGAAGQIATVEV